MPLCSFWKISKKNCSRPLLGTPGTRSWLCRFFQMLSLFPRHYFSGQTSLALPG